MLLSKIREREKQEGQKASIEGIKQTHILLDLLVN
jgi:hypothetical protein